MPRLLLASGIALLGVAVVVGVVLHRSSSHATEVTVSVPARTTTEATTTETTTTTTTPAAPAAAVQFSWDGAGAIVVNLSSIGPTELGPALRDAGFDWVAVYLGGPDDPVTPDPAALYRLRVTSGLPVGGWSVLGDDPAADAALAVGDVQQYGLDFYIADAEAPYGYTNGRSLSGARFGRSRAFVDAFRAAEPSLPAGLSSYCRPDEHDLDWSSWVGAGFVFLPQAYVNDFGAAVSPAACVGGASKWFAASDVHPTVGSYAGKRGLVPAATWVRLLAQAHTTGFSIYPAEVGMTVQSWQTYAHAISSDGIANQP
jgi:hypothetical protein